MPTTDRLRCPHCDASFDTEGERTSHQRTAHPPETEEQRTRRNEMIDEQIRESFPASDPPSTSPVTGVGAPDGDAGDRPTRGRPRTREVQAGS